jgi:murein DD-endopeptidase MepM/ murein hydrolase activator NlpD
MKMVRKTCLYFVLVFITVLGASNCVYAVSPLEKTGTGFYFPTGTSQLGSYAGWLASGCFGNRDYLQNNYHLGKDIAAEIGDVVYAISDGIVTNRSTNGWESTNIGIVIKHKLNDGTEFLAVYGHIISDLNVGNSVVAGAPFGTVGPHSNGSHLHFGIHPGLSMPASNWGLMPCPTTPPSNGIYRER